MKSNFTKILITSSTLPADKADKAPDFVSKQADWLKKLHPELDISVLAPHNAYAETEKFARRKHFDEYRFHYFWPFRLEKLTGRGIQPALIENPLRYFLIPFLLLSETIATYKLIRKINPDLVYAHWFMPQAVTSAIACKLTKKPLMFTTHASDVVVLKKIPFAKSIIRRVCKQAVCYTAVSKQTADKLLKFISNDDQLKSKLHIIPMGTNLPTNNKIVTKNKVSELLFVGRIVSRKGIDYLLNALADIKKTQQFHLTIAGDGQDKSKLEELTKKLGLSDFVDFVGYVSGKTKQAVFDHADIVVLPSINEGDYSEGLPVVMMEGLAAGKIIVASNVTGAQEHITNKKDGFIFPQKDVSALSKMLQEALKLTEKQVNEMTREAIKLSKRFAWDSIAEQHYHLINEYFVVK